MGQLVYTGLGWLCGWLGSKLWAEFLYDPNAILGPQLTDSS